MTGAAPAKARRSLLCFLLLYTTKRQKSNFTLSDTGYPKLRHKKRRPEGRRCILPYAYLPAELLPDPDAPEPEVWAPCCSEYLVWKSLLAFTMALMISLIDILSIMPWFTFTLA